MVDTPKGNAPSDQQIDQAYQQALNQFEPSELLDKRIQNLAKQQAKQNSKAKSYSWAAAPWWASAASLACVGVLGWWLVTEISVPPSEISYQSNVQLISPSQQANELATDELDQQKRQLAEKLLRKRELDTQAIERERRELAKQKAMQKPTMQAETIQRQTELAAKSAEQHYALEEQPAAFSSLPSDEMSDAVAIAVSDAVLQCVEQALSAYSFEQLELQLAQTLPEDAKQALTQPPRWLSWQQIQWKLVTVESGWLIVGDGLDVDSSRIYRLPNTLEESCKSP
ncbi:hypothetical protein F9L16_08630 [Agarivorans sp. B2Z047]|uniref:hypothetical protein n=1 Tax=Agarivorans sp. B2Z047 TaxID=2652721 RepID=UPI00128C5DFF|nr:hypothetical protein [Agarivorans sp. B2Z047]MPW29059.1 hypothetical protein [Agarivorans sp. B2Z047]UQN41612.1 hypothetical protein LQZ07_17835 [Agarivorans sp. B2Z047]